MPDIKKIVDTKGAAKVGGIMVDMFTASMISQIYDKVNDSNKKKMEKSNISTLVDLAQRLMRKSENNPFEEAANPAQQAAIAIAKKKKAGKPGYDKDGKSLKKKNVMDSYKEMWENGYIAEEVANITVDPKNRINSGQQQGYFGMEIAKQARRFGLKSAVMHKHIRIKGPKKKVNDFLRVVIGKSRYGDPTEKDMTTPQIDKMLNKGMK